MDTCSFYAVSKLYIQLPHKVSHLVLTYFSFRACTKIREHWLEYRGIDFETGKRTFIISLSAKCAPGKIASNLSNENVKVVKQFQTIDFPIYNLFIGYSLIAKLIDRMHHKSNNHIRYTHNV